MTPRHMTVTIVEDHDGADPLSVHGMGLWLPTIGPTATVLAQRLIQCGKATRIMYATPLLAHSIGVKTSKMWYATRRLERYELASIDDDNPDNPFVYLLDRWPEPPPRPS